LAENEPSRILIEPSNKVVETLRLAMLDVGLDELVRRTSSSPKLLERWVNGKDWIPLSVVKEACEVNRNRQDAPSYSKILSECTTGAQFKIAAREEAEKSAAPAEAAPRRADISAKRTEKPSAPSARRTSSSRIAGIAVALFIVPLIGAAAGFLVASSLGAVVGTILSFAIVTAFAFALLLPRKVRSV